MDLFHFLNSHGLEISIRIWRKCGPGYQYNFVGKVVVSIPGLFYDSDCKTHFFSNEVTNIEAGLKQLCGEICRRYTVYIDPGHHSGPLGIEPPSELTLNNVRDDDNSCIGKVVLENDRLKVR